MDLDGNGYTDLVYVDFGNVHFWLNILVKHWTVSSPFSCKTFGIFLLEHLLFLGLKKLNKSIKTTSSFGSILLQAKRAYNDNEIGKIAGR